MHSDSSEIAIMESEKKREREGGRVAMFLASDTVVWLCSLCLCGLLVFYSLQSIMLTNELCYHTFIVVYNMQNIHILNHILDNNILN